MCKKLTSLLLTFMILFSMVSISASADVAAVDYNEEEYRIVKSQFPWFDWTNWPEQVPIRYGFESGYAEDGEGYALHITGGNMGVRPDAGALYTMPAEFDLTDAQVIRLRYKATAPIDMYFNRAYQVNAGAVIPETEMEIVKSILGDEYSSYFDEDGKNIRGAMWKNGTKSSAVTLPSTDGEWQTKEIQITDFGDEAFLKTMRTAIVDTSYAPGYQVVFTNYQYGEDLTKYVTIDSITGICAKEQPEPEPVNSPRQLKTLGNQFVYADDPTTAVRLTGVNVPGGEWTGTPQVEKIDRSVKWAIDNWNANLIRLPVSVNGWTGNYSYVYDGGRGYRDYIDSIIQIANEKGVYVILDLHHYRSFNNEQYLTFWQEAATKYANNPTVLFGILNEPAGTTWEIWRDGDGDTITGHQQVVEMIRDLGAKNIIVAGGINYGYDLTGIADGYALVDQGSNSDETKAGYGIAYDAHIYNHNGVTVTQWDNKTGAARKQYPVIVGEFGWANISPGIGSLPVKDPDDPSLVENWVPAILAWLDDDATYGSKASYAAYCIHISSEPPLIENDGNWKSDDYAYPPTEKWGVPIKAHLTQAVATRYTKVIINYGNFDDDEDASIDTSDLHLFKLHLKGKKAIKNHHRPAADLDGDGYVDTSDLQELKLYISKGRPFSVHKK